MVERIALRVFWSFMLLTAGTALLSIWAPGLLPDKLLPTFFIPGFAAFLIWAPLLAYRFLAKP
jgi:hypothetical protein